MIPQVITFLDLFIFREHTGAIIQEGDLFHSVGLHKNKTKKSEEVLEKNASEWTGRVEISKKEIPGRKRSIYGYILTYYRR